MNQREAAELMRLTSEQMRRAGMGAVIDDIIEDTPADTPPSHQLLRMLDALDTQIRAQDTVTREQIMGRFTDLVRTPDGEPPDGLWLDLAPQHRDLFRRDRVDMTRGAPLRRTIEELQQIRKELALELDEDRGLDA